MKRANILQEEKEEVEGIQETLSSLDRTYFRFDEENKRYRLNIDVRFRSNEADLTVLDESVQDELEDAGKS
jgi:hypothetical protein